MKRAEGLFLLLIIQNMQKKIPRNTRNKISLRCRDQIPRNAMNWSNNDGKSVSRFIYVGYISSYFVLNNIVYLKDNYIDESTGQDVMIRMRSCRFVCLDLTEQKETCSSIQNSSEKDRPSHIEFNIYL